MHTRTLARSFVRVLAVGAALGASPVFSATIYSNFGPGDSYNSGAAYGIGPVLSFNSITGESFVPGANFQFSHARLALAAPGLGGSQIGVFLEDDNGGNPGAILDSLVEQSPLLGGAGSVIQFNCASCPDLTAGTTYWIVAAPASGSFSTWFYNNTNDNSGVAYNLHSGGSPTPGSWLDNPTAPRGAFEVDGTQLGSVPEPGSLGLSGMLALLALRRVRRPVTRTSVR